MDLPLSSRVTSTKPSPAGGGGLVTFSAASGPELQREADRVLAAYGEPGAVPNVGGTPATMIRGMSLAASSSGSQFVCELQIEPDETLISSPIVYPIEQQTPINATVGTFDTVGFSSIQVLEVTDPSEIARLPTWANLYWAEQFAKRPTVTGSAGIWLYEVAMAGPFNRAYVVAVLWGFQDLTLTG